MALIESKYLTLIWINVGLTLLTVLATLLFCSLIYDNGYQLYVAFLLIPLLTFCQLLKIYFLYKSNTLVSLIIIAILMIVVFYIPLSQVFIHNMKVPYSVSVALYFASALFYIIESIYFAGKKRN